MERAYSIAKARNHLAALVHTAETGNPIRLTRRGKPVAVLLSERDYERLSGGRHGFWEALQAFWATTEQTSFTSAAGAFDDVRDTSIGRDVCL